MTAETQPEVRRASWRYWLLIFLVIGILVASGMGLVLQYKKAFGFPDGTSVSAAVQKEKDVDKSQAIRTQAQTAWGQFGDFIGGTLNPLVSLLALFVLLLTYKSQSEELAATQEALSRQANEANRQRKEARFFDLVRLYQDTIDEVRYQRNSTLHEGKRAFFQFRRGNFEFADERRDIANAVEGAANTLREHGYLFDHYFRVLFNTFGMVGSLLDDQSIQFVKLLRAQLSGDELVLLAINTQTSEGAKMIPLIEAYGLLKHLPEGRLRTHLEAKLPAKCFGNKFVAAKAPKT